MKALLGKAKIAGDQGWAKWTTARNLGGAVRGAWRGLLSRSSAGGRDLPSELLCSFSLCLSLSIGLNKAVVSTIRHRFRLFRSAVPRWLFYCPTTIQKLLREFRPEAWSSSSKPAALLWPLGACPTSPTSPRRLGVSLLSTLPSSTTEVQTLLSWVRRVLVSEHKIRVENQKILSYKKVPELSGKKGPRTNLKKEHPVQFPGWFQNDYPLNVFSPTSLHTCAHPATSLSLAAGAAREFPHICCYFRPDSTEGRRLQQSKASRSLQISRRSSWYPPFQKLMARPFYCPCLLAT